MAFAMRSLGVIVLFAAVMLVVSHNWDELGRGGRMGMIVGLLVGLQGLAFALHLRRSEAGSVLAHLAAGLGVGAAIFMTGQVYHLDAHAPNAVLAWCLASLPFVLLLDWTILHVVHIALACTWLSMKLSGNPPPGEGFQLVFLALIAPSAWAGYRTPRATLVGVVALAYAFMVITLGSQNWNMPLAAIVAPLALAALHPAGSRLAESWRAVGFLATAVLMLFIGDLENLRARTDFAEWARIWKSAPVLTGAALAVVALAAAKSLRLKDGRRNDTLMAAGALALAELWLNGTGHPAEISLVKAGANLGTLAMVASLLQLGLNEGRLRPYLAGGALFLVWLGWRYANIHEAVGYLGMAAVFAVLGVALFVLARLWRARAKRTETLPAAAFRPATAESLLARLRPWTTSLLIATYAVQLGVIGWMVWHHGQPLREGRRFVVRCEPVDPRDLAKGDYVILGYPFGTLNRADLDALGETFWAAEGGPPPGMRRKVLPEDTSVYLPFTVGADGLARPGKPSLAPPTEGPYLRGYARGGRGRDMRFGIEAFYVKEGTGKEYEKLMRTGLLLAEIAVLPNGRAGLVELKADPEPMTPLPFSELKGWKPAGWGSWVISDVDTFTRYTEQEKDAPEAVSPDFTRHRVVLIRGPWFRKTQVLVEANSGLVRVREAPGLRDREGNDDLLLLIPADDKPVYGPQGRIDQADLEI
jgi:uncharacterized membrane-anchored protein